MDINDLLEELTPEDIISFMENIGAETFKITSKEIIFSSICHNNPESKKLYYYIESRDFHCFSNCYHIGNLLRLLMHINDYEIKDAINEVKSFFNISSSSMKRGFKLKKKYKAPTIEDIALEELPMPEHKPYIHKSLSSMRIQEWEDDNIEYKTMKKFEVRYDIKQQCIVIPHFSPFDKDKVIGVRCREMNQYRIDKYGKYHPYYSQEGHMYNHKLGHNLYGLSHNKNNIKKYKKCVIVEAEKGVMQYDNYFPDANICVGICGSSLSLYQAKLLIELGVEVCVFALDKEFSTEEERELYKNKVFKLASKLVENGVECYLLLDEVEGLIELKDSPLDRGKEIFMKLIENKIRIGD